jgi:hypothetical protein
MSNYHAIANRSLTVGKLFKYIIFCFLFAITVSHPLVIYYQTKQLDTALYDLAKIFFGSTATLAQESSKILAAGVAWNFSGNSIIGFFKSFWGLTALIASFGLILFWICIIKWLIKRTPFSSEDNKFVDNAWAFIIFYIFQVIYLLASAGLSHTLVGITGDNSVGYYLLLPFTSLLLFIKTIPILLEPLFKFAVKIDGITNSTA